EPGDGAAPGRGDGALQRGLHLLHAEQEGRGAGGDESRLEGGVSRSGVGASRSRSADPARRAGVRTALPAGARGVVAVAGSQRSVGGERTMSGRPPLWAVLGTLIGAPLFVGAMLVYLPWLITGWRFGPP